MTIPYSPRVSGPYTASAAQTLFGYDWPLLTAADVQVVRSRAGVETVLTLNVDYSVLGVGDPDGGQIALAAGALLADKYVIIGAKQIERTVAFPGWRSVAPGAIDNTLDEHVVFDQELRRDIARALLESPFGGEYDAKGRRLANLAPAIAPDDAVTQQQLADTLEAMGGVSGPASQLLFSNRAVVALSAIEPTVTALRTLSYSLAGDGGGALYKRVVAEPSHAGKVQSVGGIWWELAERAVNPLMFGAVGDGVADDVVAVGAALSFAGYSGDVYLPEGKTFLVSSWANAKGANIRGPGRIVTTVTGGQLQRNTYADAPGRLHLGHEYVNRVYQYMALGQGGSSGTAYIRIFGDSTATDAYGNHGPSTVLRRAFVGRGIPNHIVENFALSGHRWSDFDFAGLVSGTALFILSFGINDAADAGAGGTLDARLATMAANMDAKLSALRTAADVGNLAIILKMPNSTSDSPNWRDERWYEKVREIYVVMARKYQCAMFDTYGQFRDSRGAAGRWMDDPYADGRAIHPASAMNNWVWGRLVEEFFPSGAVALYGVNRLDNQGAQTLSLSASVAPSSFAFGISIHRAVSGSGWPIDGFVETKRNVDGGCLQTLWGYPNGSTKTMTRTSYVSGDSWNPWSGAATAIPLSNSWVAQGAPWRTPVATKSADGIVTVEGLVNGGTVTAGTVIGTLPAGFRPIAASLYKVATNGGQTTLSVNADGTIKAHIAADGTFTSLSGISFLAA